ncbi:TPA: hypothetical protein ACOEQZ_001315 [Stenotrophomonas maltophilia]
MANDQQKPYPQVSSTFAPAATANLTGADYRVGRGLSSGAVPSLQAAAGQPAAAAAPAPAAGTRFGRGLRTWADETEKVHRRTVNAGLGAAEGLANAALAPGRTLGGFARDAVSGFNGTEHPDAGKPLNLRVTLPRLSAAAAAPAAGAASGGSPAAPAATAAAPGPVGAAAASPQGPTVIVNDGTVGAPENPYLKADPKALVPGMRTLDGQPGGVASRIGEHGENVYDNASLARLGQNENRNTLGAFDARTVGGLPASLPVVGAGAAGTGAVGAVIGIPGEAERRAAMRQSELATDLRTKGRGSPSMRRALVDQYQAEQGNAVSMANNAAKIASDEGLAGASLAARSAEAGADRQLRGLGLAADIAQRNQQGQQVARMLTGADGNAYGLTNDGTVRQITGADGKPFRGATDAAGAITPKVRLDFLGEQRKSINDSLGLSAEEKASALADVDAQIATLLGGNQVPQGGPTPPEAAIAQLRANPGTRAQFDATFGAGAAARYLGK